MYRRTEVWCHTILSYTVSKTHISNKDTQETYRPYHKSTNLRQEKQSKGQRSLRSDSGPMIKDLISLAKRCFHRIAKIDANCLRDTRKQLERSGVSFSKKELLEIAVSFITGAQKLSQKKTKKWAFW